MTDLEKRVILALDVISMAEVINIVETFSPRIQNYKVGARLFCAVGPDSVKRIIRMGQNAFFDLKLHDIPHTVSEAVVEATHMGVQFLNLHVLGGVEMMTTAARLAREKASQWNTPVPKLLGVTVLTSTTQKDLDRIGIGKNLDQLVLDLASLAQECGLDGVIASGHEVKAIKERCGRDFMVVTPGIRPTWAATDDQKRVMTPMEAIEAGADYIVIGRPLLRAPDPLKALDDLFR